MDAAVRLYHKRNREQMARALKLWQTGERFENTNSNKIWDWALNRWNAEWSYRECQLRDE